MLRDSPKQPKDNGVWLVFSETANLADPGFRTLRMILPALTSWLGARLSHEAKSFLGGKSAHIRTDFRDHSLRRDDVDAVNRG
jgi:hypothetical protein